MHRYHNFNVSILESREGEILLQKSFQHEHEGEQLELRSIELSTIHRTFYDAMIAAEQLELKLRDKGLVDNFNLSIDLRSPTNREAEETSNG